MKYYPYGECWKSQGTLGTDKLFTGQRLDDTGLYYYGARYYDPLIGRFISPDPFVKSIANPQMLNRFSYVLNNPLKYVDPSGLDFVIQIDTEYITEAELDYWHDYYHKMFIVGKNEIMIFLTKQSSEQKQFEELAFTLQNVPLTDIKLVGFGINGAPKGEAVPFGFEGSLPFGASAMSLRPLGILAKEEYKNTTPHRFGQTLHEEFYHWGDQYKYGSLFYLGYIAEYLYNLEYFRGD